MGDPERPAAARSDGDAARALRSLIERLRDLDALILIDTPPVLPVSDARLIAPHCDGVLLVVSAGTVKPAALESALERLEIVRANMLGIVLNQSGEDLEATGGYYYTSPESAPRSDRGRAARHPRRRDGR